MAGSRLDSYRRQNVTTIGLISEDGIVLKSQEHARTTDATTCSAICSPCISLCNAGNTGSSHYLDEPPYFGSLRHVSGNAIIPYGRIINVTQAAGNPLDPFIDSVNQTISEEEQQTLIHSSGSISITYIAQKNGIFVPETIPVRIDESIPTPTAAAAGGASTFLDTEEEDCTPTSSSNSQQDKTPLINAILKRSYQNAKMYRRILVIVNPHGGKGNAKKIYLSKCEPILKASTATVDIAYTKYAGHAIDIAREVDLSKYDTIACASGDGIPYEVINGLNQRSDRVDAFNKLAVTQIPCGSGNAMSVSCHWTTDPSLATLCVLKGNEARIDLMACSQISYADISPKLSFLSQTYGVIAESDINTEFIRWMGPSRFDIGVAFNVFQRKKYPCEIYVKYAAEDKESVRVHFEQNKDSTALVFEETTCQLSSSSTSLQTKANSIPKTLTDEDFELKYPLNKGVPTDWIKIDEDFTNNIGIFYTGKMPYIAPATNFFPAALPSDGAIDLIMTDARTPVSKTASILLSLDKGAHVLDENVVHTKILAYKIIPKLNGSLFSVDGEKFPLEPLQVEVMPQLCKTILRNGRFVDSKFLS
ncbi:hypothetical protein TPHA_0J00530 [Tetrapisispora phaffii CBS 4417]|uniref:sphingosine kinase n=1 Tax=Tetrapisispora phaffii (strain ATCC 24235 / CBS 4417 / NBRC 1672 / NRRL Y-8282 / UCD 70-5) TaxID=1071381 RepID=G8BYD4_TETPH|nr:hypothetical protein TPHA_0J00530 [Tetrapisispora phaffii CBS 4417]CCE64876.1 hypothetical protein TPHA_0J00530 [Tetrapisispora phaffii CBS 4417]